MFLSRLEGGSRTKLKNRRMVAGIRGLVLAGLVLLAGAALCQTDQTVLVQFDDLTVGQYVPYLYKGVYWPIGTDGFGGMEGHATVVSDAIGSGRVNSKPNAIVNEWGVRRINIRFESGLALFHGAWFVRPNLPDSQCAVLVAFLGFRNGQVVGASGTLVPTEIPQFLAYTSSLLVDEIQITAAATYPDSKRWYNLDDLSYTPVPEPGGLLALGTGLAGLLTIHVRRPGKR